MFKPLPQILENIIVKDKKIISNEKCKKAIKKANKLMNGYGKLISKKIWYRAQD